MTFPCQGKLGRKRWGDMGLSLDRRVEPAHMANGIHHLMVKGRNRSHLLEPNSQEMWRESGLEPIPNTRETHLAGQSR